MLNLLIFAPCEKVIIAQGGQSSAIGIIETIRVLVEPEKPLAEDSLIPFKWGILILWNRPEPIEGPVIYETEVRIFRPDKTDTGFKAQAQFEVNVTYKSFRLDLSGIPVFPAGQQGIYELRLFLRRQGDEDWEQRGVFPVAVDHVQALEPEDVQENT